MDTRPIGMFDSGCGGLTVLKEYLKLMPNENYIYYGDTAHLPYGDKSKEKIIEFSRNIVEFLISKNVKMIVIACGTASAQAFSTICKEYDIPIEEDIRKEVEEMCNLSQGIKEKTYAEIIYMMYKSGLPIEQIAGIIKMSTDKVKELVNPNLMD